MSPRVRQQAEQFLVEVDAFARKEGKGTVDLVIVPSPGAFGLNNNSHYQSDILTIAQHWENQGWGTLYRDWRPKFSLSEAGIKAAKIARKRLTKKSLSDRLRLIDWAAVNALAAWVAAIAALFAAYFSYLALSKH